jgi:hypothetical protein
MSAPQNYPLSIYRGDTHRWSFTVWADAARTEPADLTGVTVAAAIRGGTAVATTALTCDVTDNVITVTLAAATSQDWTTTGGRWDLQLTHPSGDVQTIVAGSVQLRADVTGSTAA